MANWNKAVDGYKKPDQRAGSDLCARSSASSIDKAGERDYVVAAAGGLPGEVNKNWRVKSANTFDCEYGFSCMGYEMAGWLGRGDGRPDPRHHRHGR